MFHRTFPALVLAFLASSAPALAQQAPPPGEAPATAPAPAAPATAAPPATAPAAPAAPATAAPAPAAPAAPAPAPAAPAPAPAAPAPAAAPTATTIVTRPLPAAPVAPAAAAGSQLATTALAPGPGHHRHDGFFLRFHLGVGAQSLSFDDTDSSLSGGAGEFSLAIGGALSPSLVLYGELWTSRVSEPEFENDFGDQTLEDTDLVTGALSLGLAYYFRSNLYLAGTLGAGSSNLSIDGDVDEDEAAVGPLMSFAVGKEWWVSSNWGLGVAGRLTVGALTNDDTDTDAGLGTLSVLFSATYN